MPRPSKFSRLKTRLGGMSITLPPTRARQRSSSIQALSTGRQSATLQQLAPEPGIVSERYQVPSGLFGSAPSGGAAASRIVNARVASKMKARITMFGHCNGRAAAGIESDIALASTPNSAKMTSAAASTGLSPTMSALARRKSVQPWLGASPGTSAEPPHRSQIAGNTCF
jgi:hypothetical protein